MASNQTRSNYRVPYISKEILEKRIERFLSTHKTTIFNQADKISAYFEMGCYNNLIDHYHRKGYIVKVENLIDGAFRYKLSPSGNPKNFSYFSLTKCRRHTKDHKVEIKFEIHHNVAVQSKYSEGVFLTPDIVVVNAESLRELRNYKYYFSGNRSYWYFDSRDLQTFFECKNYNPFPELVFSFMGIVNEIADRSRGYKLPRHIAPSLLISGQPNYHLRLIKQSLEQRRNINIVYGLFSTSLSTIARKESLTTIGTRYLKKGRITRVNEGGLNVPNTKN